jgi:hypothetical protein
VSAPLYLSPDEAREFIATLRANGIVLRLVDDALDVSGPATALDVEQLRTYAGPVAAVLRAETHSEPPVQPSTAPAPPVAPTAPAPPVRFRGEPISNAAIKQMLASYGEEHRWDTVPRDVLERECLSWLRNGAAQRDGHARPTNH